MAEVNGREVPDPTPMEMPVGLKRPPSIAEQIAMYMRSERSLAANGVHETFEEANDFDVGEDEDFPLVSRYTDLHEDNYVADRRAAYAARKEPKKPVSPPVGADSSSGASERKEGDAA